MMELSHKDKTIVVSMSRMSMYIIGVMMTILISMVGYFVAVNDKRINNLEMRFEEHAKINSELTIDAMQKLARIEEKLITIERRLERRDTAQSKQ